MTTLVLDVISQCISLDESWKPTALMAPKHNILNSAKQDYYLGCNPKSLLRSLPRILVPSRGLGTIHLIPKENHRRQSHLINTA
jgi:hypothetical protein